MHRPSRVPRIVAAGLFALLIGVVAPAAAFADADLSIVKTDSADPITEGQTFRYIFDVANAGPDTANGVEVTDRLPKGMVFLGAEVPGGGSCATNDRKVTCRLNAIESGKSDKARIRVRADAVGTISNTAKVKSGEPDPVNENNRSTTTTTVNPAARCAGKIVTIVGTDGNDSILGTDHHDVIYGAGGDDAIQGLKGNDVICGGPGNDSVKSQGGNDTVRGGGGNDSLQGGGANDSVRGGTGSDNVQGGTGNDRLEGLGGDDLLKGFGGDDVLRGGGGNDSLHGGGGADACQGGTGGDSTHGC